MYYIVSYVTLQVVHQDQTANRSAVNASRDLNSHLYCPHDLSTGTEFRDDLPTLLGKDLNVAEMADSSPAPKIRKPGPALTIFTDQTEQNGETDISRKAANIRNVKFVTPYQRYLAVLPFAEKQRLEEIAKQAELNRKKKLCPEKTVIFANDKVTVSHHHHLPSFQLFTSFEHSLPLCFC